MAVTFADIIPVTQVASHEYTVELEDPWCIGTVPNGGYVTSTFMVVARTHMQTTHSKLNQPDIINLHLEFLRRTSAGPATLKVTDIKIGSRISNLHLTLSQRKDVSDPNSPVQDEVQGYFTISNISHESGPSNETAYRLQPPPLPVSLHDLSTKHEDENYMLRRSDAYHNFRRASYNVAMHLVKPSRRTASLSTPAIVDQWIQFRPIQPSSKSSSSSLSSTTNKTNNKSQTTPIHVPGRWTNDSLGYLVDTFPQIHEQFVNTDLEDALLTPTDQISAAEILDLANAKKKSPDAAAFWYPTLLLNLDVKKKLPDEGVEWLFMRVQAKSMTRGRFDLQIEVWDDPLNGELVALSTHACLIVDARRNTKRPTTTVGKFTSASSKGGRSKI